MKMKFPFFSILLIPNLIVQVFSWGIEGHKMVAQVASHFLSSEIRDKFNLFFPKGSDMISIASWPDFARNRIPWYNSSHYTGYPEEGMCSVNDLRNYGQLLLSINKYALEIYEDQLDRNYNNNDDSKSGNNNKSDKYNKPDNKSDKPLPKDTIDFAARMLVHLIGDSGQVLHFGCACNRGGNDIHVRVPLPDGSLTNMKLHAVWDEHLIERQQLKNDNEDLITSIINDIENGEYKKYVSTWKSVISNIHTMIDDLHDYGNQRAITACKFAYSDENGNKIKTPDILTEKYLDSNFVNVVRKDIAASGIILASVIEMVMSGGHRNVGGYKEGTQISE